ncbi:hypothetical protein [Streptomyces sp. NPDC047315]|uniref:hypothetical protein n=1 Tax=Streptomyces sp. NPDC047315 TaxID=3155142 RepID=UPI00340A51C1
MKVYTDPIDAEAIPDGTFGGARFRSRNRGTTTRCWSPAEQRDHYNALAVAIGAPLRPDDGAAA